MYPGLLILDKPAGMTSHDVVARVRKKLHTKKVGHAGTLDPDATGVLVLCVGDATRLLEYVAADDKVYIGEVVFGEATDTDDASGQVIAKADASMLTGQTVENVLPQLTGDILQRPPRFSAVHVDGKRAYDLAREGVDFELPLREVHVYSFSVSGFESGVRSRATFQVHCSKGTYIRSLCRDWGQLLGVPAHMAGLKRVQSGSYSIDEAVSLGSFEASDEPGQWLRPMVEALRHLPQVRVSKEDAKRLGQGQLISPPQDETSLNQGFGEAGRPVAVLDESGELVAVAQVILGVQGRGLSLKPRKVLWKGGDK